MEMPLSQNLHMMLSHTIAMRKRSALIMAIAVVATPISLAPGAHADSNPVVTPTPMTYKEALEQFRVERENYNSAMKARGNQIRAINIAFKNSCDTANKDYKNSMSAAKTPDQKNAAIAARKNSISAAIVLRDSAIAALGAEPVAPVEPMKPSHTITVTGQDRAQKNKSR